MATAVRRSYACPICGKSFTKWGLCMSHLRTSVECRDALGIKLNDEEEVQEMCRQAALALPEPTEPPANGGASAPGPPAGGAGPASAVAAGGDARGCAASAPAAPRTAPSNASHWRSGRPVPDFDGGGVDAKVKRQLYNAVRKGSLTSIDTNGLTSIDTNSGKSILQEVASHPTKIQMAAVGKFLALGAPGLRQVCDKKKWLKRCLAFCIRTISQPQVESSSAKDWLLAALATHALLPDALSKECWDIYTFSPESLQRRVSGAVRSSILANVTGTIGDHFMNIVRNEKAIDKLRQGGYPHEKHPVQFGWENIDGTIYDRILEYMQSRVGGSLSVGQEENSEELVLRQLGGVETPTDTRSLLQLHASTREVRNRGSALRLSALHAAAACGYVRVCARLIAEGLPFNERVGLEDQTPLDVAVAHGQVEVVRILLDSRAQPWDGKFHSPLSRGVRAAHKARTRQGPEETCFLYNLILKACSLLLTYAVHKTPDMLGEQGEERKTPENFADQLQLVEFGQLIRLHAKFRKVRIQLGIPNEVIFPELRELEFETAKWVVMLFEKHANLGPEAAQIELRALIASEFIQVRDEVQQHFNRLYQRFSLSRRAKELLMELPPQVGKYALSTLKVEEFEPHRYVMRPGRARPAGGGVGGDTVAAASARVAGVDGDEDGGVDIAAGDGTEPRMQGRVRKWDSERGFGFIVPDFRDGEDAGPKSEDIFVHRKNVVGSSPLNHIDLQENCRISYKLESDKDGRGDQRPRAIEAVMIDADGNALPVHRASGAEGEADACRRPLGESTPSQEDMQTADPETIFRAHIESLDVQEQAKRARPQYEAWLRCVGFRATPGRRDDGLCKREIDKRIDIFLSNTSTPLDKKDFDFRVRRFLLELTAQSSAAQVSEALARVEASTSGKGRDEVRVWPAYIATLLKKFDPNLHEVLAERDKKSRDDGKRKAEEGASSSMAAKDGSGPAMEDDDRSYVGSSVYAESEGEDYSAGDQAQQAYDDSAPSVGNPSPHGMGGGGPGSNKMPGGYASGAGAEDGGSDGAALAPQVFQ